MTEPRTCKICGKPLQIKYDICDECYDPEEEDYGEDEALWEEINQAMDDMTEELKAEQEADDLDKGEFE